MFSKRGFFAPKHQLLSLDLGLQKDFVAKGIFQGTFRP